MIDYKKQIIKQLDRFQYSRSRREVFLDAVEYNALSVATKFDIYKRKERLARMDEILKSYTGGDAEAFSSIRTDLFLLLQGMLDDYGDHLGEIYMEIEAGNKHAGQYFTPYHVSKLMAEITLGNVKDREKILTLNEPCCGSGGMVVAAADVLAEQDFNYTDKLLVVANDIDRNCVNMAYLQISFAAVPAIVHCQDTFTQKISDTFVTPAFALQYPKFKRELDAQM